MPSREQPAAEPYESRDLELGRSLRSWTEVHATSLDLELEGPLDAPGMDPTRILRMSGPLLEAEVILFYGPRVQVSAFFTQRLEDGMFLAGEDGVTDQRLMTMLNGLQRMSQGDPAPGWLRGASRP
jgi:hypothetical protein